jgi:hypothetical protein
MYHSVLNNPEASVFMISIAPCRDYANRKIKCMIFSTSIIATYTFTTPKCTTTIIVPKPCALNVEFNISHPNLMKFSYFILTTERKVWR